jgi:hypothetical protein
MREKNPAETLVFRHRALEVAACLRCCALTKPTRPNTPEQPRPQKMTGLTSALWSQYAINQNCKQMFISAYKRCWYYTIITQFVVNTLGTQAPWLCER